jgi:hypothetical protein
MTYGFETPTYTPAAKRLVVDRDDGSLATYLKQRMNTNSLNINVLTASEEPLNNFDESRLRFYRRDLNECAQALSMLIGFGK